ncbi:MAG: DUF4136 domain-containing protein [Acidobacteria bacterium]|nr:DUF4136 domain-containing protein [Acidobacteriota bacterium]
MKVSRIIWSFLLLLFITGGSLAQDVKVDWDKTTSFAGFRTYAWGNNTHAQNPIMDQRIIQGIESQLAAKGLQKVEAAANPDLVVLYHAATSTETQINTIDSGAWGPGWGWGWGGGGMSTSTVNKIPIGQLIVDIGDVKSKKYIWRATASGTISDNPEKNQKTLNKALVKMFDKFPPPVKK